MSTDKPAPLVPAEVDLRDFATMPLAVQLLRDSRFAAEVSPDAFRAGVLLWCAAWHQVPAGTLPDNDAELAKLAGYGFVVKEWRKVKAQAMTKFVLCSDGRWHHEELAERAVVAWRSRLDHFYERAKERLRKANKARSEEKPPRPALPALTFEEWNERRKAAGTPMEKAEAFTGVPQDEDRNSGGKQTGIPPENALKGTERERRRNGEGELLSSVPDGTGAAAPKPSLPATTRQPPATPRADPPPEANGQQPTPYGAITRRLMQAGVPRVNPGEIRFRALVDAGVTAEVFLGYVDRAKGKGDPFAWIVGAVEGELRRQAETPVPDATAAPAADPMAWRRDTRGVMAMAAQLGVTARPGEGLQPFTERIVGAWQRAGQPALQPQRLNPQPQPQEAA